MLCPRMCRRVLETDEIRLSIQRGDMKGVQQIEVLGAGFIEEHLARIMEIEVTGTETVKKHSATGMPVSDKLDE